MARKTFKTKPLKIPNIGRNFQSKHLPGTFRAVFRVRGKEQGILATASVFMVNGNVVGMTAKHIFTELAVNSGSDETTCDFEIWLADRKKDKVARFSVPVGLTRAKYFCTTCDVAFFRVTQTGAAKIGHNHEGHPLKYCFTRKREEYIRDLRMERLEGEAYHVGLNEVRHVYKYDAISGTSRAKVWRIVPDEICVDDEEYQPHQAGAVVYEGVSKTVLGVISRKHPYSKTVFVVPIWVFSDELLAMFPRLR